MAKSATDDFSEIQKQADTYMKGMETTTTSSWGNSSREATLKAREMKNAVSTELGNMDKSVTSHFQSQYNIAYGKWQNMGRDISSYVSGSMSKSMSSSLNSFMRTIRDAFSDMYSIGHNAAQSLRNGMNSVSMPRLSYYISSWNSHNLGNGGTSFTPVYSPNWYAKGGLFSNASVIGVGEAGQEAVLPLENRRAMRNIADSIVNSSNGNMGLSKEELTQAVAQGVAIAMMNNQGNNNSPQYIMNSITLDGREFAKAVTKAQNDTNRRFNPSPAY